MSNNYGKVPKPCVLVGDVYCFLYLLMSGSERIKPTNENTKGVKTERVDTERRKMERLKTGVIYTIAPAYALHIYLSIDQVRRW